MGFVVAGDTHMTDKTPKCRIDAGYGDTCLYKFKQVLDLSAGKTLLHTGDLTDTPQVGYDFLISLIRQVVISNAEVIVVFGQHDLDNRQRSGTVLALLDYLGLVKVAGKDPIRVGDVDVYGWSFDEPEFPEIINEDRINVLLMHKLVTQEPMFKGQKSSSFYTPNELFQLGFDFVFTGDNHKTFVAERDGRFVANTGSMMRKAMDQIEHKPVVFKFDPLSDEPISKVYLDVPSNVFTDKEISGSLTHKEHDSISDFAFTSTLGDGGDIDKIGIDEAIAASALSGGYSEEAILKAIQWVNEVKPV